VLASVSTGLTTIDIAVAITYGGYQIHGDFRQIIHNGDYDILYMISLTNYTRMFASENAALINSGDPSRMRKTTINHVRIEYRMSIVIAKI